MSTGDMDKVRKIINDSGDPLINEDEYEDIYHHPTEKQFDNLTVLHRDRDKVVWFAANREVLVIHRRSIRQYVNPETHELSKEYPITEHMAFEWSELHSLVHSILYQMEDLFGPDSTVRPERREVDGTTE